MFEPEDPVERVHHHALAAHTADQAARQARQARDAAIHTAFAGGATIRQLATAAGVTPARIAGILGHPHGTAGRPRNPT